MYLYALSGSNNANNNQRLRNAAFLHKELPIRIAQRAVELSDLPYGLAQTPSVRRITHLYASYVSTLQSLPSPTTADLEAQFTDALVSMVMDRADVPTAVNEGLMGIKDARREVLTPRSLKMLDTSLSAFFLARVGLRFLTEHHISCDPRSSATTLGSRSGLISNKCDPVSTISGVVREVESACERCYGASPAIRVVLAGEGGKSNPTMTYVPTHLRYMVGELLMNSCAATVGRFGGGTAGGGSLGAASLKSMPPVRVVVAAGDEDVTIKVSDEGGGVPRSEMDRIWTFAASTLRKEEPIQAGHGGGAAGGGGVEANVRGFGLPLARIYARYFGGELTLKSMEGYGVDTYLHLPVLGTDCENLPERVENSPGNTDSRERKEEMQSWKNLLKSQL